MRKIVNHIYDDAISFEHVNSVWNVVFKTCKNKKEVLEFSLNKNTNIYQICYLLKSRKYQPYSYRLFLIFEPKPILVMSQRIQDKIVNHFVAKYYLLPYLESKLEDFNVATRKRQGKYLC